MGASDGNESSLLSDLTDLHDSDGTASFLEVAFDAVVTFDIQEQITSWNPAAEKMFGWTAQEAMGKTPVELFWPTNVSLNNEDKKQRQARMRRGETLQGKLFPCRKDGSSFPADFTARAIFDPDGNISGFLAVYRDVSDKVEAREKQELLQKSNQRLNQILVSIQDDFYVLNRDWNFVFASRTFTSRIGKEPEDFVGKNIWEMFPKHVGGILYTNFHIAMEKREIRRFEIPGRYTDAWYRMSAFPSEEGITVIGTDITDRRRTEQALQENQATLQSFYDSAPFLMGIAELEGDRTVAVSGNRAIAQFFDTQPDDLPGKTGLELGNPEAFERLWIENYRRSHKDGAPVQFEYEFRRTSGSFWLHITVAFIGIGSSGNPRFSFVAEDITEQKKVEQALRQQAQLLNLSGEAIFVWELGGAIEYWNKGAEKLYGYSSDEAIGQESHQLLETTRPIGFTAFMAALERDGEWRGEVRHKTKDGHILAVESSQQLIYQDRRKLVLETNRDITARKQAEDALRESEKQLQALNESLEQKVEEKTAEVRRLGTELVIAVQSERHRISHILHDDLQQRIYAIQMQLTFLHHELGKMNEGAYREISDIERQLTDVLEITRNLSIDLSPPILRDEGLTQAISWLAGQMKKRYNLPIEIQADGSFILPNQEIQVLLFNCVRELLFNVVKHAEASRAVVTLQWFNDNIRIDVRDDGRGFPVKMEEQQPIEEMSDEENLQVSFGLPTLRHQLSLFGGQMEIRSDPGEGTVITLIVPVAKAA